MNHVKGLDSLVKARLRQWPQCPPGLKSRGRRQDFWLRGRPTEDLPDGLWLNFGGTPVDPFVDIFAVEACGSMQNLLDKRSRFAPSTHSLLAVCPVPWLLARVDPEEPTPRWQATGMLRVEPVLPFVVPVRDMRVLYHPNQPVRSSSS